MNFKHLGYQDGMKDAREDIEDLGLDRAKRVALDLEANDGFSEVYKTGYSNTVSKG